MPLTPALPTMLGAENPAPNTAATVGSASDLTDAATILRKTTQRDIFGSPKETWGQVGSAPFPCKLSRSSGSRELAQAGETRAQNDWECKFNAGVDVRPPDRLRIANILYEVTGTDAGISGAVELTAFLRKITR